MNPSAAEEVCEALGFMVAVTPEVKAAPRAIHPWKLWVQVVFCVPAATPDASSSMISPDPVTVSCVNPLVALPKLRLKPTTRSDEPVVVHGPDAGAGGCELAVDPAPAPVPSSTLGNVFAYSATQIS